MNIVTSFYQSTNELRNKELIKTICTNLINDDIEKVHLFVDSKEDITLLENTISESMLSKIVFIDILTPTYRDLFVYANKVLNGKLVMICNSDIYLYECDNSLCNLLYKRKKVENNVNEIGVVFSLTRYEHDMSCPLIEQYMGSHDAFIFMSPIPINETNINFYQNIWGSENMILHELEKTGFIVCNPCYQIKIVHLHESNCRDENRPSIATADISGGFIPPMILKLP